MISFLLLLFIRRFDGEVFGEICVNRAICMALTEIVIFLTYVAFGLKYIIAGQTLIMVVGTIFSVYGNLTAYIDLFTGYVYRIVNLIFLGILLFISCIFIGISPEFTILYIFYSGIIFLCEKMQAFCRGDTEVLLVLYWAFVGTGEADFVICFMFVTMLVSALLFDVFRRVTGRKGEMLPYTPFIVLSETINLCILLWL